MALILPALHSKNLRLTPGERRFGTALLRNLEDDYFCWVDVPVGPKQRRPDFMVLHPNQGIVVLEIQEKWARLSPGPVRDRSTESLLLIRPAHLRALRA